MKINLHQVDAFTDQLFGGNPAGVVTNADGLTVESMQKIAREMNLSETAFVVSPSSTKADVSLRFFTPTDEVDFCGHATVSALFQLANLSLFGLGKLGHNNVRVETNIGVLDMAVITTSTQPEIRFIAPKLDLRPYRLQGKDFAHEFGVSSDLIPDNAIILHDKNLNYLYIPTSTLDRLGKQVFDFRQIRQRFGPEKIVVFCLFSNQTVGQNADLHARGLAPNIGIDEDPFTGSMQAGLVQAAKENKFIPHNQRQIVTEQGHFIGRPGSATVIDRDTIVVAARAVQVFSTTLEL